MLGWCLKGLIKAYQWTLSPWVGRGCRYIPTCSNYGLEAIERFGAVKGRRQQAHKRTKHVPYALAVSSNLRNS